MFRALLILVAALILYLVAWPVPADPVAWDAPENPGHAGVFAENDALAQLERIEIGPFEGPEDVAVDSAGDLYTGTEGGQILRITPDRTITVFAETGGRPLGLEFDGDGHLLVANAYLGLQRVDSEGSVTLLTDEVEGSPIRYADDVDVAPDGRVYFSDASTKFAAGAYGGTMAASVVDLIEHGGHGRVLVYDPGSGGTGILMTGLNFANGIAVDPGGRFLLVNETGTYRILRHWLTGPRAGETEVLLDRLPGFPDNINRGLDGRFWVGLVAPRNEALDALSSRPFLRKVVQRLPEALVPAAAPHAHVFAIDAHGEVVADLQGDGTILDGITGVLETPGALLLSSVSGAALGHLSWMRPE